MAASRIRHIVGQFGHYAGGLAVRGVEVVGKLGLYMLAAAALGTHDAGLFFLCITWIGLASTAARLGLERAITRHIAAEIAVGRGRAARAALFTGLAWTFAGGAVAALVTLAIADPVARHLFHEPELARPLALSALLLVPQTWVATVGHALAGLKRGVAAQLVQNASWPALTLLALLAGVDRLDHLLYAMAGALALSTLLGLALIVQRRDSFRDAPDASDGPGQEALPSLWHTALPLGMVEVIQVSISAVPVLVLGMFADPAAVGAFSVAHRISILIWVVIISIGTVAAPHFAELHRRGQMAALRTANRRVRLVTALAGIPIILAMTVAPAMLLRLVGPGFDTAAPALVILAAGQLVNCLLPSQDVMLAMTGHGRQLQRLNLLQFLGCCALSAILIPAFGMIGAALVGTVAIIQGAIGTSWMVRRLMPAAF